MSDARKAALQDSGCLSVETRQSFQRGEYGEALRLSEASFEAEGDLVLSERERGLCCLLTGRVAEALDLFHIQHLRTPGDGFVLCLMGCANEFKGLISEAVKLYRKALVASPRSALANANLGYLLLIRGNVSGAIGCLQRLADLSVTSEPAQLFFPQFDSECLPGPTGGPDDERLSGACFVIGMKLQELGRFEQARDCFERSIALDPRNGAAYNRLTVSQKLSEQDLGVVQEMQRVLAGDDVPVPDRIEMGFALGKAMDDLGRYAEAMAYLDEAHALAQSLPDGQFDRADFRARINDRIQAFTRQSLDAYSGYRSTSETPILIVGMIRSGTTLVEQILSCHPDVAAGDELTYWPQHASMTSNAAPSLHEGASLAGGYLGVLREIDPFAARVTDKLPGNFEHLGLVHLLFPNARIICCRRNPVDTCLSIYMTAFRHAMGYVHRRSDLVFFYREFERLTKHWQELLPSDRLIEVPYEDLLNNRHDTTRRLLEFCGLEWNEACLFPESNRRAVKTASVWQVRQSVYSTSKDRWRRYEPWLGELRELLTETSPGERSRKDQAGLL